MTQKEAAAKFREYRRKLTGTELVTDDGRDTDDMLQNSDFSVSISRIKKIRAEVRAINVDGLDCNKLWKDSFNGFPSGWFNPNAPEDLYTQTVTYIDLVMEAIESAEGE